MAFSLRLFVFSKSFPLRYINLVVGQVRVLGEVHHSVIILLNSLTFSFLYLCLLQYLMFLNLSCSFYVQEELIASLGQVGIVSLPSGMGACRF